MYNTQSGNVIFYIFIAVGLLGALSYVVAQTTRGGVSGISEDKARLMASEIVEYADIVEKTFLQLRLRGCALNEITFENSAVSSSYDYTNPSAPSDQSCHIFELNGGGLNWRKIPELARNMNDFYHYEYFFNGTNNKVGTISNLGDLMMFAEVNRETCVAVDELLNLSPSNPPEVDVNGFHYNFAFTYKGSFGATPAGISTYSGYKSGCFQDGSTGNLTSGKYYFYQVLVER